MSDFRFGFDDYRLNYYPSDATDGMGGVDWDNVERVEIEYDMYVKERTCEMYEDIGATQTLLTCSECGYTTRDYNPIFCGGCGACVKAVER